MNNVDSLVVDAGGKITLPDAVRARYGFEEQMRVRIIETSKGVLLIPLTDEPMSPELISELEEWQSLSIATLEIFPYEDE
jgi:bifunctional DNA-binding transcriptional regulator/antitoxin component of YhaV-PrlF toxin-antitoxin module